MVSYGLITTMLSFYYTIFIFYDGRARIKADETL